MAKKPNDSAKFQVRLIKMRQGETLVCQARRVDNTYIIKNPMLMIYIPFFDKDGNMESTEIAFRDWIEGSVQKEYQIPADAVLVETDCDKTIRTTYQKMLLEDRNNDFFSSDYLDQASELYDRKSPKSNKKGPGITGPAHESLDDDEQDLDDGDFPPPRFRI